MNKRLRKQIIIGFFYLFLFSAVFGLFYFFNKSDATCFDRIQNQGEEEIDCGGPCGLCRKEKIKDIQVLWVKLILATEKYYDLVIRVNNPNQNYGSGEAPYEIKIYDKNSFLKSYQEKTYILPNQEKFIVKHRIEKPSLNSRLEAEVSFGDVVWQQPSNPISSSLLSVQEKEFSFLGANTPGAAKAKGLVVNETSFDFEKTEVDVILYDEDRNIISARSTEINTFLSGEKREFTINWYQEIKEGLVFLEMEAETNFFDPDNYISKIPEGIEKFQEYK